MIMLVVEEEVVVPIMIVITEEEVVVDIKTAEVIIPIGFHNPGNCLYFQAS